MKHVVADLPEVCFFSPLEGDRVLRYKFLDLIHEFPVTVLERDFMLCHDAFPWLGNLMELLEVEGQWQAATVVSGDGAALVDGKVRSSPLRPISADEDPRLGRYSAFIELIAGLFIEGYQKIVNEYVRAASVQPFEVARYGPGDHFNEHVDTIYSKTPRARRVLTLIAFWASPDLTGGELVFPRHGLTITPRSGDVLVFPSDFPFVHEAKEVLTGVKHSLVTWYV